MNRSIQVIDQLRAEGRLRKNKLDGGERVASVPVEHSKKSVVVFGWLQVLFFHRRRVSLGQPRKRLDCAIQVFARLPTRLATLFTTESLAGVCQQELVALLDGVATSA